MAVPVVSPIRSRAATSVDSAGTTVTVNYPSSVVAGDLLLVLLCSDTTQTFTASGWTQLGSTVTAETESSAVFYKTATGTEDGTTFSVGTTTASRDFEAVCWAIVGGGTPEMGTPASGSSASPAPPSTTHSAGAGTYLFILGVVADLHKTITEWPDGMGDWLTPAGDIGSIQLNTASGLKASATYAPSALTLEATDGWHAYNIAVPITGLSSAGYPVHEGTPAVTSWEVDTTSQTINLPSGITAGELLIAEVSNSKPTAGGFSTMTVSISGWTEIGTAENFATSGRVRATILAKTATGSEGATATLDIESPGDSGTTVVRRFSGADTTKVEAAFSNGSSATATIPTLTPTSGSDKVIWLTGFAMDQATGYPEVWAANGRYGLGGVWGKTTTDTEDYSSVYSAFEGVQQASLTTFNVTLDQSRRFVGYTISIYPGIPPGGGVGAGDGDTTVEVGGGFGTGPFGEPTYTDISTYIRAMDFGRGRSSVFQSFDAGTATLVLDNRDGRFDPGNTAGSYYPDVAVGAAIRVRLDRAGTTATMWVGNIDRVRLEYPGHGHDAVAVIEASENIGLLVRQDLNNNYAATDTATRVDDVLDEVGWPTALRSLSANPLSDVPAVDYSAVGATNVSAWAHLNNVALAEQGAVYVDKLGYLVFEGRTDAPSASSATFGAGVGEYPYQGVTFAYDNDLLINRAKARYVDGNIDWEQADDTTSQGIHGIRLQTYELDTLVNGPAALSLAQWVVLRYATVVQRVASITINPDADPTNLWPFVRDVELRDLITVKFVTPGAGDDINQVCRVEWLRHTAVPGQGGWNLTLGLLPVPDVEFEDFFILDSSVLDGTDVLA